MEDGRATANVRVDGAPAEATLSDGELRWRRAAGGAGAERALSLERDVLGVQVRGKEVVVRAFVAAAAGAPRALSCAGAAAAAATGAGGKRCRRDFVLHMADGEGAAVAWGERLTRCLDSFGRPKRLYVFVNPFGGKKCARKIYDTEIKPLFEAAGVSITVQETEYQGHAREVASSLDLAEYDGVVCVSGDGILVEALVRIMNLRKYCGSIQFVPAPGYEAYGEPIKQIKNSIIESVQQNGKSHRSSYPGPSVEFQASDWRFIDGPFIAVWVNNVPWASQDIMAAPEAKFSDGYMDAAILRDCPKADLLALLLKMSDGSYVKSPYVTYLKVRSFQLSPGQLVENPKRGGIIDVDGEVIARGKGTYGKNENVMAYDHPIQLTVHQALATIYCPDKIR